MNTMEPVKLMKTMKTKANVPQILRHLVQAAAFLLFPGLFLSIFTAMRDVVVALVSGTFSFAGLSSQLVLLLATLLFTALWGRFFCGYMCAFGTAQELVGWLSKKLLPGLRTIPSGADRVLKYVKYVILTSVVVFIWILQMPVDSSLNPWGVFGMLLSGNLTVMGAAIPTIGFAVLAAILIGSFFVERCFCRYLCPLGAMFSLLSGFRLFRIRRKEAACSGCGLCSRTCAMGLSVHDQQAVSSGECINCMRCIGGCRRAALSGKPYPAVAGIAAVLALCVLMKAGSINASLLPMSSVRAEAVNMEANSSGLNKGEAIDKEAREKEAIDKKAIEKEARENEVMQNEAPEGLIGSERYADGVYTGSGNGFRGDVTVQVTVENGEITDIKVLSYKDDAQYFNRALSGVVTDILSQQSPEVDTVSGATFSSRGIMAAVADALSLEYSSGNGSADDSGRAFGHGSQDMGAGRFRIGSEKDGQNEEETNTDKDASSVPSLPEGELPGGQNGSRPEGFGGKRGGQKRRRVGGFGAQNSTQDSTQDSAQDSAQSGAQNSVQNSTQNSAPGIAQDRAQYSGQQSKGQQSFSA